MIAMARKQTLKSTYITKESIIKLDSNTNHYIKGINKLDRVTHFVDTYKKKMDLMGAAIGVRKAALNKGITPKLNISEQLHYWNLNASRASNMGTSIHNFAEMYDMDNTTIPYNGIERSVLKFIEDYKGIYTLIGNEVKCFNENFRLAGTIDRLLFNPSTGKYIIMDWKTSKDIDKTYNKLNKPFNKFPQSKRLCYEIQVLVYKNMLNYEINIGKPIQITSNMFESPILVILDENGYTIEEVNTIPEELIIQELNKRVIK